MTSSTLTELHHRSADGIEVSLLWSRQTNSLTVAVEDSRSGESFELPLVYFGVMVALFATGPGAYSVDAMAGRSIRIAEPAYGSEADEHSRAA